MPRSNAHVDLEWRLFRHLLFSKVENKVSSSNQCDEHGLFSQFNVIHVYVVSVSAVRNYTVSDY